MYRSALGFLGLSLLAACNPNQNRDAVGLDWKAGDSWYLAANYRVATVRTEEAPSSLDGEIAAFDEHWSDDVVWTYQVVEEDFTPTPTDELHDFAVKQDGSVAELTVLRAWLDASLNTDPEMLEADPVVYLVFRSRRDRLAGIVSFVNVDGERVENAWSASELERSYGTLSQSLLTPAPTYLAPFGFENEDGETRLENGSYMNTATVDTDTVAVVFEDELGGGTVATEYTDGAPWPTWTVSDNLEARLLSDGEVSTLRRASPWLANDPPPDYNFRAALAASVNVDAAVVLDAETMAGGYDAFVPDAYQPWNGSWWRQSEGALVFGYNGRPTVSDELKSDIDPLKKDLDNLSKQIRDMEDGEEKDAKTAEYREKQSELVDKLVAFYDGLLADMDGGKITVADGQIKHSEDGWSYDLDVLSPFDKMAVQLYFDGETTPNPWYVAAWEILNHYSPAGGSWWGHCNGWAAAAILTNEPVDPVTVDINNTEMTFTTADQKGLLSETHYSTYSRFYGKRYYKDGDDRADLTPKAFHQLVTFYVRDQRVPGVFDTDSGEQVWNFPFYGVDMDVVETTDPAAALLVNINLADAASLDTLPGIGEALAAKIINHRLEHGPFQSVDALAEVNGIGGATVNGLRSLATVDPIDNSRTFDVTARVYFATDGVNETHVDNGTPEAAGFVNTYEYELVTTPEGTIVDQGTWKDIEKHPDFMWVPYSNPGTRGSGGSENPYLAYDSVVDTLGNEINRF